MIRHEAAPSLRATPDRRGLLMGFDLDAAYRAFEAITGIDEAGRGCLAGPVVVAAVTWNPRRVARLGWFSRLADSKLMTAECRTCLYPEVLVAASRVRVAVIDHVLVDYLNILAATLHGFELVAPGPDDRVPLLIDGNQKPPSLKWGKTVVRGDARLSAVAGASVVAKVFRDHLMAALDARLPGFELERHKGYATAAHRAAIAALGASPWHRKSFRPLAALLPAETQADPRFLAEVRAVAEAELAELWQRFRRDYPLFSLAGARRIVAAFQARGFPVLPAPMTGLIPQIVWDPCRPAGR